MTTRGRRVVAPLSLALVLGWSGVAAASVSTDARQVVVTTPGGARAVVERSPFRLSVLDASGRTVLAEQPRDADLLPVPPTAQSQFGGSARRRRRPTGR